MENFVKAMNQAEAAFTYLWEKFPRLSEAKLKQGIFIGPQTQDLIKDEYFDKLLKGDEKGGLGQFQICTSSRSTFGKQKGSKLWGACKQPFAELPEITLQHFTKNTLPSLPLGFFPDNCGAVSDEHGECSIKTFLQWRRGMKGNGTVLCSPTTAGLWQGIPLPWNTDDRQNEKGGD